MAARRLRQVNENSFVFQQQKEKRDPGEIKCVKIHYVTYQITTLYEETAPHEVIRTMNYDPDRHKIAMLTRSGMQPDVDANVDHRICHLKLFDVATSQVQLDVRLSRPEIIGILSSGYYTLVDGHIYHNNNVIKMRYDLLESKSRNLCETVTEEEFFDCYDSIFPLRPGCRISSSSLLNSLDSHRFAFLSEDTLNQELPLLVRITPYLHERRVYLRKRQPNKRYFLTSMDVPYKDRKRYNDKLYEQITKEPITKPMSPDSEQRHGQVSSISIKRAEKVNNVEDITCIIRMNITDSWYHVFAQNGQLLKRVNFKKIRNLYGDPIACSNDGKILVFRAGGNFLEYMHARSENDPNGRKEAIRKAMSFTLIDLSPTGLMYRKAIDVFEGLEKHYTKDEGNSSRKLAFVARSRYEDFQRDNPWLFGPDVDVKSLANDVDVRVEVNNAADFCIRLSPKDPTVHQKNIFYFESGDYLSGSATANERARFEWKKVGRAHLLQDPQKKAKMMHQGKARSADGHGFCRVIDPDEMAFKNNQISRPMPHSHSNSHQHGSEH